MSVSLQIWLITTWTVKERFAKELPIVRSDALSPHLMPAKSTDLFRSILRNVPASTLYSRSET